MLYPQLKTCFRFYSVDEAHMIKTRSSQTANAAFSLIGVHRWALSGTPLQNRVGEFYSLVRFLRLDPMAYYYCRLKDCDCKSMHYRIFQGKCDGCGHGGVHHYSHFNRYVLNPIQRDGYRYGIISYCLPFFTFQTTTCSRISVSDIFIAVETAGEPCSH